MNKFIFSTVRPKKRTLLLRFLEESEDTKNRFEIIMTFNIQKLQTSLSIKDNIVFQNEGFNIIL